MDQDRVKGTIDQAVGSAKRKIGDLTGDKSKEVEGAVQQVKGKAEVFWGNVKDALRDMKADAAHQSAQAQRSLHRH
jgi:uncharacterized protein YjbJ (UPF0337 family)